MSIFGGLKEKVTQYIDVRVKLVKLNFIGSTANVLSYLMFALISLFIAFCIILFIGFGLAQVFIDAGLSKVLSFFITTGIYLLLLVIVVLLRKNITRFFAGNIIREMTEGDDDDDDDDRADNNPAV